MKPLALSLLALFLLSIAVIPLQASALSAATFTSQSTFTSLNSGKWSKVWTDDRSQAIVFNGSSQYLTAASNSVYDVTTQDFWMAGMFYRTSDSGQNEFLVSKRDYNSITNPGYGVMIDFNDNFRVDLCDGSGATIALGSPTTIATNVWYAWAISADRDGNLVLMFYNLNTGTLTTASTSIASQQGSITNTQTFTVGRASYSSTAFFSGRMDMLILPQIGSTLSQANFLQLAAGNWTAVSYSNLYDFNASNANDIIGSNHLTMNGSPTFTTSVASITPITGTYFVDVNQGNFKSVLINPWGGTWRTTTATLSADTNPSAISEIEYVSGVTRAFTAQQMDVTTIEYNIVDIHRGTLVSSANATISSTGSEGGKIAVTQTKNKVYTYLGRGSTGSTTDLYNLDRNLTNIARVDGAATGNALDAAHCSVAVNGANAAADVVYCLEQRTLNNPNPNRVVKGTTAAITSLGSVGASATGSETNLTNLSDKMIVTIKTSGTENTYTVTKSTDTLSGAAFTNDWITWTKQQYDFDGTTITYKSDSKAYYATTDKAISYSAAGVLDDPDLMFAETVTPGTSTIAGIASTFYRISDTLVVTGSGTTWTPKTVSGNTIEPVLYSEQLSIPLIANSTLWNDNILRLVCDANYVLTNPIIAGDDSDCTLWRVLATSSASVGREVYGPWSRTSDLVHASPLTGYTFVINAGDPTLYRIKTLYDNKVVDVADFDSGFTASQRYLFGQCYQVLVINKNTGANALIGTVCANDITQKNINLDTITVPPNWQGQNWSWNLNRNYSNATNNVITFTVDRQDTPFDANIHIVNNLYANGTINQWFNFTSQTSPVILSENGYNSTNTLWITVYDEDGKIVVRTVSSGKTFELDDWSAAFGPVFGISIMGFFLVILAGIFPRSMGTIAILVVLGAAGIMWTMGWLNDLPVAMWPGLIGLAVIGIIADRRRA